MLKSLADPWTNGQFLDNPGKPWMVGKYDYQHRPAKFQSDSHTLLTHLTPKFAQNLESHSFKLIHNLYGTFELARPPWQLWPHLHH